MLDVRTISQLASQATPFYVYNLALLDRTLEALKQAVPPAWHVHYALKANAQPRILDRMLKAGLGADCVSGNEVQRAADCGFPGAKIVFAGVGKTDDEIRRALALDIFAFNAESMQELTVIDQIAGSMGKIAPVALRINPNVDAFTHRFITTGLEENKFGINPYEFDEVRAALKQLNNINVTGLHFHIGSQINDLSAFRTLCGRVNEITRYFNNSGFNLKHLNLGGGLGVSYHQPDEEEIVDFKSYFSIFERLLTVAPGQEVHFELGRSLVAQCGTLVSRVLYIKHGIKTNFAILDAGMTELLRPALYQAYHKIENLTKRGAPLDEKYDVVGPICESSDCFGKAVPLPHSERGDLIAIRSAGAYGETMSSRYNLRDEVRAVFI